MSAGRSLVRLALELAESRISDWAAVRVLLVGTGKYAGASLAALRERGVVDVQVFSPTGRAAKFALSHDVGPVESDDLLEARGAGDAGGTRSAGTEHGRRGPPRARPRPPPQRRPRRRRTARRRAARPRDHQHPRPGRGAERRRRRPRDRRGSRCGVRSPEQRAGGHTRAGRPPHARLRGPRRRDRPRPLARRLVRADRGGAAAPGGSAAAHAVGARPRARQERRRPGVRGRDVRAVRRGGRGRRTRQAAPSRRRRDRRLLTSVQEHPPEEDT